MTKTTSKFFSLIFIATVGPAVAERSDYHDYAHEQRVARAEQIAQRKADRVEQIANRAEQVTDRIANRSKINDRRKPAHTHQVVLRSKKHPCSPAQEQSSRKVRNHLKQSVAAYFRSQGRQFKLTSGCRTNSVNHENGAIDIASKRLSRPARHSDAKALSARLGRNYEVIVEELTPNRQYQLNTIYFNGQKLTPRTKPRRASATHTHIQPRKAWIKAQKGVRRSLVKEMKSQISRKKNPKSRHSNRRAQRGMCPRRLER